MFSLSLTGGRCSSAWPPLNTPLSTRWSTPLRTLLMLLSLTQQISGAALGSETSSCAITLHAENLLPEGSLPLDSGIQHLFPYVSTTFGPCDVYRITSNNHLILMQIPWWTHVFRGSLDFSSPAGHLRQLCSAAAGTEPAAVWPAARH